MFNPKKDIFPPLKDDEWGQCSNCGKQNAPLYDGYCINCAVKRLAGARMEGHGSPTPLDYFERKELI